MLAQFPAYLSLPGPLRLLVCLAAVGLPIYLLAWLLFRTVETGGIQLGKRVIRQFVGRRQQLCRPAET